MLLSRRAARTHLVASRHPKYFLRLRSAGSASPGSGRPVRHFRLRPGDSPQTLQTPPHDGRPVLRQSSQTQPGPDPRRSIDNRRYSRRFPGPVPYPHRHEAARHSTFSTPPAPGEALPPPLGYGPRLGPVRLDFHQQGTCAARRTLRPPPTPTRHQRPLPGITGYGTARSGDSRSVTGPGRAPPVPAATFQTFHAPYAGRFLGAAIPGSSPLPWPSP